MSEAIALQATCLNLYQKKPTQIILDSRQCTIIKSSGIGAIISIVKTAKELEIELVLQSVHPQIKAALLMAGLDPFVILDSENKAIFPLDNQQLRYRTPTHPSVSSRTKRLIDIIGALIGLGIVAILFVPIAIAIKLDSPGPILFSQTRCGWLGKHFRLWKFRSMIANAESLKAEIENQVEGPFFKNKNDSRITRVGCFLRRTSLDELPQFWNVIKGEMSLVGTRPPTIDEVVQYTLPMWQRLDVKPGITGEWQTNGRSKISNFQDVVYLDLHYQKKWSVLYDLKLIFKTLLIIFRKHSGAS
ncbi:MAG: sugar transferase [Chroococcidiopsidaceae cyanobacterium CP_BM_ER_R8_30]|nr:sugar transferase [Chroococcidiopsidaceae cyanobacterium CP_BM_ER_R8_30]